MVVMTLKRQFSKQKIFPNGRNMNCDQKLLHAWKLAKKLTYKQHLHNRHLAAFSDFFF